MAQENMEKEKQEAKQTQEPTVDTKSDSPAEIEKPKQPPQSDRIAKRIAAMRAIVKLQALYRGWVQREFVNEVQCICVQSQHH